MNPFPIDLHLAHLSEIGKLQGQIAELNSSLQEYADFWEWFEDEYGETEKEVWAKFEAHEEAKAAANFLRNG